MCIVTYRTTIRNITQRGKTIKVVWEIRNNTQINSIPLKRIDNVN